MSEEFNNFVTNVCQYFPPKSSKDRKTNTPKSKTKENEFQSFERQLFLKTSRKMNSQINQIKNDLFSPLMQSLFGFVSDNCLNNIMREKSFETKFSSNTGLIPTALLSIGLNSSEHKFICDLLVETIQDLTNFVVYLNSSRTQTMSSLFKQISETILNEEVTQSMSSEENEVKHQTFESIFSIYEKIVINSNSNDFCSPIVFFFDEIENFDHSLITSLILIIKEYMQNIPFILIMIKSNETISLQHLLPASVTDFLVIHHFNSFCGHKIVEQIIEELLIESSLPLKFGPNVLNFMLKFFENFDFSIQNIENFINCCLFQHFYSNELSVLCQFVSEIKSFLKNNDIKAMKVLKNSQLFDLSLNNKEFNKNVIQSVLEFISIHKHFVINLKILLTLLNSSDSHISLTQLYVKFLDNSFDPKYLVNSMKMLSPNQWSNCLEKCLKDFSNEEKDVPLINILKSRQKSLIEAIDEQKTEPQVLIEKMEISDIKNKLSNLKTRHQWKEVVNPSNKPKVLTKFEIWKNTTIDLIEKQMSETPNPKSSHLNEILIFDDLNSLKSMVFMVIRDDIHKSLSNPIICGKNETQTETDFHRLFDIYSESPSVFNMFDAFTAFRQSIEFLNQTKTNERNDEIIVRFISSVSDLEYMGLIESSKHKSDHLMRLIWF